MIVYDIFVQLNEMFFASYVFVFFLIMEVYFESQALCLHTYACVNIVSNKMKICVLTSPFTVKINNYCLIYSCKCSLF